MEQNANAPFWLLLLLGGYLGGENSVGGFSPIRRRLPISNTNPSSVFYIFWKRELGGDRRVAFGTRGSFSSHKECLELRRVWPLSAFYWSNQPKEHLVKKYIKDLEKHFAAPFRHSRFGVGVSVLCRSFVAESSGTVLSANIVTDTTALVSSPKCNIGDGWETQVGAHSYRDRCYHAELGTLGCNTFYNQSIAYTERPKQKCPFVNRICVKGIDSTLTLDTGLVDVRTIGINSAANLQFRRTTTCAPLKVDGELLKLTRVRSRDPRPIIWDFNIDGRPSTIKFYKWSTKKTEIMLVFVPLCISQYRRI